MKKKGFTLVELLATIALLAIILLIGTTSVSKIIKENKQKAYNIQIDAFLDDVRLWAMDNVSSLPANTKIYILSLADLINGSYASSGVINPLTGLEFNTATTFCVINNDGNYTYHLDEGDACGKTYVTYSYIPSSLQNGYSYSTTVSIDYSNVIGLNYYVKSSHNATSSENLLSNCGTSTNPSSCSSITSTTALAANTWYKVSDDTDITYTEADSNTETLYAITNDGSDFSSIVTASINKIDRTNPVVTLTTPTSTTNSISIPVTSMTDDESGIASYTCNYGTSEGNYTATSMSGTGTLSKCTISYRSKNTTYYYQVCATDKVGNTGCAVGNSTTLDIVNPTITYTNDPTTPVNGYVKSQIINVDFDGTNITSPYYYIKTTRSGVSSLTTTYSCGTSTNPSSCSSITSTTTLAANTWYRVSGDVSVTYTDDSDIEGTLYALTYDGNNYSSAVTGTISKVGLLSLGTPTTTADTTVTIPIFVTSPGSYTYTCKYSTTSGSYTTNATSVDSSSCVISGIDVSTAIYYQVCMTDSNNVSVCKTGNNSVISVILAKFPQLALGTSGCATSYTSGSSRNYSYMNGCYLGGTHTDNYMWYSGFVWRIMGINSDNTIRMTTEENISTFSYNLSNTSSYTSSYVKDWLNNYFYNHLKNNTIISSGPFCDRGTNYITSSSSKSSNCSGTALTDKVGIISLDEYNYANSTSSYLPTSQTFITSTPYSSSMIWYIENNGNRSYSNTDFTRGVRPIINISSSSSITGGNGTLSSSYVLSQNKNTNSTGNLKDVATSGEYVTFVGKKYRVVGVDGNGNTKLILDSYYEENSGTIYRMAFGSSSTFDTTTTTAIGYKLNNDILNWLVPSSDTTNSNKLVTYNWYQTNYNYGNSYSLSLNETSPTRTISAKVGLIRVGEMLSSNSLTILNSNNSGSNSTGNTTYCWTITPDYSTVWITSDGGTTDTNYATSATNALRPVIVVNSSVTITSGNGTPQSPYQI